LIAVLSQVNQTIAFQSGIQAFTCPEGFAPPLAPIVQKSLKATPRVMTHLAKYLPGIPVVKVVTPASKDAVDFSDYMDKSSLVTASGLFPDLLSECRYGLLAWHDVEIVPIPALQVTVVPERESQKIQALFPVQSDNPCFVPVYAQSKDGFELLFQPASDALTHKSGHYHKVIGKPYHARSGEMEGAAGFFVECPVEPMKVDIRKERRDYSSLRGSLFGTADAAVLFPDRTIKPLPDQFENTPIGYAPLEFFHQGFMGDAVKVARKIRVIHFLPSELQVLAYLVKGSMSAPFRAEAMRAIKKVSLKDRFEDKKYGSLNDSVTHTGYAQRTQFAVRLGYVDPFHRGWFIALGSQALLNFVKIARYTLCQRLDGFNADTIDPGAPLFAFTRDHAVSSTSRR
jgi:hypothetical protein